MYTKSQITPVLDMVVVAPAVLAVLFNTWTILLTARLIRFANEIACTS